MKQCDTCGGPLADGHPFTLCPKCLFGQAIGAPAGAGDGHATFRGGFGPRRDFFERYDILEKVAGGGQGEVWKVLDLEFRRCVAMKRIAATAAADAPAVQRFLAEAQIASQLEHPGVLPIFDMGFDPDGRAYYTTQLLSGKTLEDVWHEFAGARGGGGRINRAVELLIRVCEVMAHAHSRGVIHRDLKPANILVGAFGDVRVVDWGSAYVLPSARQDFEAALAFPVETDRSRVVSDHPDSPLATASSGQPVTLVFAPPETIAGELTALAPATDIYAVGVTLYQLLTDRLPYHRADGSLPERTQLKAAILRGPPPPARSVNRSASPDLAAICQKAMAHDRGARYSTMEELAEDLHAVLEIRPVKARGNGSLIKLQKWSQRNFSYVLLAGGALALLIVVLSSALGFKVQRDAARQSNLIRQAELAARGGHWREAIQSWNAAEADGYADTIDLDLQKAEAWTILSEPDRSALLLKRLAARSDLGSQRGSVLLRLGEHELFDGDQSAARAAHGVHLVQQAMSAGLNQADRLFAKGLLADSTPEALELFHQVLQYAPYHHAAHQHSLSLEFLLGHHRELADHVAVFRILYPDDPTPVSVLATEAAMAGDLAGAEKELAMAQGQLNSNAWEQARLACRAYATAAKFYDVDALLARQPAGRTPLDMLRTNPFSAGILLMPGDFTEMTNRHDFRLPRLPSIQRGTLAASDGLRRLLQPYLANPVVAVEEIESGWQHHPEGLIPALGGMLLENQEPAGPPLPAVLKLQARLYQTGADSSSMMPSIQPLARYLAARTELELAGSDPANAASAISNCLANVRAAAARPEISAAECRAYLRMALELGANELALQIVNRLEAQQPNDPVTRRGRVEVETALGAFGPALQKVDELLSANPSDSWAMEHRRLIIAKVKSFTNSVKISSPTNP